MERKDLISELKHLATGDHLCHLYGTDEERRTVAKAFLCQGLQRGERVVYAGGEGDRSEVLSLLRDAGLDVDALLASGQMAFRFPDEIYVPGGVFDPAFTLDFLTLEAERSIAGGWPALRTLGEMSWALAEPTGWERLTEYEAEVNRLPAARGCILMCQYDGGRFGPSFQVELLRTHPRVVVGTEVYDNVYYVPPGEFFRNMVPQSVLAYHLNHLKERKRAVSEIQAAREYAEAIVETVREPMLVLDSELRVVTANRSFYRTFGVSPKETEGRPFYELEDRQWDIPELRIFLEEIIPLNSSFEGYAVEHDFPQTGRRTMLLNARRIHREGNDAELILLAMEDITERRVAEERVHRLNEMFLRLGADFLPNLQEVVNACRDLMNGELAAYARLERERLTLYTTASGKENLFMLDEPARFTGFTLLETQTDQILAVSDLDPAGAAGKDPLVSGHGFRTFLGCPVRFSDRTTGALSVYFRERRSFSEEELETMATLARALAVEEERLHREQGLKDFIDIASHELRHPVTLIKGYALSLKERRESFAGEHEMEMLAAIDEGADRLTRLVDSLLDLSRIERGQLGLNFRESKILSLAEKAAKEMGSRGRRILLRTRGKMGTCRLDPDRFLEVMLVLLENADKFSPAEEEVEVELESRPSDYLVSVLDRGVGVPEEGRKRIFARFYQVEQVRFHSKPGMGMGLYIAREIVELHGGRIWCEPREGGGSVFRFTIPK